MTLKDSLKNKKILIISISVVSVFILACIGLLVSIYTKDKPKFIPEETRGEIREGVKDNIVVPLTEVPIVAPVAKAVERGAYVVPLSTSAVASETSNWPTYRNEELGFEIKYPEGWSYVASSNGVISFAKLGDVASLNMDKQNYEETDVPYWGGKEIRVTKISLSTEGIVPYINNLYGVDGVQTQSEVIAGRNFYLVTDNGPDRFGGGRGYYYYVLNGGSWFEIGLDYFMNQEENNETIDILGLVAKSIKL